MNWAEIGIALLVPLVRSISGWSANALKDRKISKFEIKKLIATVVRTSVIAAFIYFGADSFGIDVDAIGSACGAVVFDMILSSWKESKNVTTR